MKVRASLAAVLVVALISSGSVSSQDKEPDWKDYLQKYGSPGPEHKNLQPLVGTWEVTAKFWMKPGGEPEVSKGTSVRKWILGNRYLSDSYKGEAFGQKFAGQGLTAYDRYTKKYAAMWVDSMSTSVHLAYGTYDPKKKTFTFTAIVDDPLVGAKVKAKDVITIRSNDEHTFEMYRSPAVGEEKYVKVGELHCKRVVPKATTKKSAE